MFRLLKGKICVKSGPNLDGIMRSADSVVREYDIEISKISTVVFAMSIPVVLLLGLLNNEQLPTILTSHDKLLHFFVFAMETALFLNCFVKVKIALKAYGVAVKIDRFVLFVVFCVVVGGIGGEYLQNFVNPKRSFDCYDMVCNCLGSALGYVLRESLVSEYLVRQPVVRRYLQRQ